MSFRLGKAMKNALQCVVKIILIGMVAGQGFPNRPMMDGPVPLPYFGNRGFYPGNPMPAFPRPHPPPPLMYRDEGLQPPSILYRNDIGSQPGPPFYRNDGMPPAPPVYREGMQPVPPYYHEEPVQPGPALCREGLLPCPTLYREPGFRPVAGLHREEVPQLGPVMYRDEGLQEQEPFYQGEYQAVYEAEPGRPEPCSHEFVDKPSHQPPQHESKAKPSKCSSKGSNKDCQSSTVSPLKMNIEPSKQNFNTLRAALRMPIEEPASIAQQDQVLPTIIIEETVPVVESPKEDEKGYFEDDYSDNEGDEETQVPPQPTLINPYQYFEPVKICSDNGNFKVTVASKPCASDIADIIPVLRSPITILPSRFPPRVEQIIERIQTYFSTYNHQENQKPVTTPTSTTPSTSTVGSNSVATIAGVTLTSQKPTTPPAPASSSFVPVKTSPEPETSSESAIGVTETEHTPGAEGEKAKEKTTISSRPITVTQSHLNSGKPVESSSEAIIADSKVSSKDDCDDCQEKTTTDNADCDECKEKESEDIKKEDCDDCKEKETESVKKEGCDDCEKE